MSEQDEREVPRCGDRVCYMGRTWAVRTVETDADGGGRMEMGSIGWDGATATVELSDDGWAPERREGTAWLAERVALAESEVATLRDEARWAAIAAEDAGRREARLRVLGAVGWALAATLAGALVRIAVG